MGATVFETKQFGKDVRSAFQEAVKQASHDFGHAGYTGTIAEKDCVAEFKRWKGCRMTSQDILKIISEDDEKEFKKLVKRFPSDKQHLFEYLARQYDDKMGCAVAIQLSPKEEKIYREKHNLKGKKGSVWLFCGWAAC